MWKVEINYVKNNVMLWLILNFLRTQKMTILYVVVSKNEYKIKANFGQNIEYFAFLLKISNLLLK